MGKETSNKGSNNTKIDNNIPTEGPRRSPGGKPVVAVSYSPQVGGLSVQSVFKVFKEAGADVMAADYREMLPVGIPFRSEFQASEYNDAFNDPKKLAKLFQLAKAKAEEVLKDADCLVIPGNNAMVDPLSYGKTREQEQIRSKEVDNARAIAEMAMLHVAMRRGMPILGICGGHQLINVYLGGEVSWLTPEKIKRQKFKEYSDVTLLADSEFAQVARGKGQKVDDQLVVERFFGAHNQAVKRVGGKNKILGNEDYLRVVARANDQEQSVEAVEAKYGAPLFGVQFHPEIAIAGFQEKGGDIYREDTIEGLEKNQRIVEHIVGAAKAYKNKMAITPAMLSAEIKRRKAIAKQKKAHPKSESKDANGQLEQMAHRQKPSKTETVHSKPNKMQADADTAQKKKALEKSKLSAWRDADYRRGEAEMIVGSKVKQLAKIEIEKQKKAAKKKPGTRVNILGLFNTIKANSDANVDATVDVQLLSALSANGESKENSVDDLSDYYRAKCKNVLVASKKYEEDIVKEIQDRFGKSNAKLAHYLENRKPIASVHLYSKENDSNLIILMKKYNAILEFNEKLNSIVEPKKYEDDIVKEIQNRFRKSSAKIAHYLKDRKPIPSVHLDDKKYPIKLIELMEKYNKISEFNKKEKVAKTGKHINSELQSLYKSFTNNYHIFDKRADSAAQMFLKVVLSFFAGLTVVGLFALPKIWKKADTEHISQIEKKFR